MVVIRVVVKRIDNIFPPLVVDYDYDGDDDEDDDDVVVVGQ